MRKIYAYTTSASAIELFETNLKYDDETSALAICNHNDYVILATSDNELLQVFENAGKTEKASDLDLMNLQMNDEIKEIRGREYTIMPFT